MIENMTLAAEILSADEERLVSMANKGLYKRALKDIDGAEPVYTEENGVVSVSAGGEVCRVSIPLEKSSCTCPSRGICRHIIAAILMLRSEVPEGTEIPEPVQKHDEPQPQANPDMKPEKPQELSRTAIEKIHECADICLRLLCGVTVRGLVRCAESTPDDIELAAVRCHALKIAEGERKLRAVSGRLRDCIALRAAFDISEFTGLLCRTSQYFTKLQGNDITYDDLGSFRAEYEDRKGLLEILPIGIREVKTGEYQGSIYYFLDLDKNDEYTFLHFSDLRPVFYDDRQKRPPKAQVWDLGTTLYDNMRRQMTLSGAKISGGKLSSSSQTSVVMSKRADVNCPAVHRLIHYDLREIAFELSGGCKNNPERLFFIHPDKLIRNTFDKYSQTLVMTIADSFGNHADIRAKYRQETRSFIELLEKIGRNMQRNEGAFYTLLVSADIQNGRLALLPIEVYDFLTPVEQRQFSMPAGYDDIADKAVYSQVIYELFDKVDEYCCALIRSGLSAGSPDTGQLLRKIRDFGLFHFHDIAQEFFKSASLYRHGFDDNCTEVLINMQKVKSYIAFGRRKTALISALYNMKGE